MIFFADKKTEITDMTQGSIARHIINFAMPLMLGNIFQQLYNTVDSIIVGNYVGKEALAAIGATSPFVNTLIGFFMGFSTGGGILISQYFGAKNISSLRKAIHTMILSTLILGFFFTAAGIWCNLPLLHLNSTPQDIIEQSHIYLTIHFSGIIFLMLYNIGSGILRALGDSKRPVQFLIISSIINVLLDLFFVISLNLGIAGAAYATMISQAVSAFLVIHAISTGNEVYKINFSELKIDFKILHKILVLGVPGGIQSSLTSFSNVFVQGYINTFGSDCVAGWATFNKIDQICLLPIQSLQMSITTYVGQNFGADNIFRAKKGVWIAIMISLGVAVLTFAFMQAFATSLIMLFNKDSGVIYYGKYFLRVCTAFYMIRVINPVFAGALRGFGNTTAPMLLLLNGYVFFRQIYLFVVTHLTQDFFPVSICYPIGWAMCSVSLLVYYICWTQKKFPKNKLLRHN